MDIANNLKCKRLKRNITSSRVFVMLVAERMESNHDKPTKTS